MYVYIYIYMLLVVVVVVVVVVLLFSNVRRVQHISYQAVLPESFPELPGP